MKNDTSTLVLLAALIGKDSYAAQFQSLGQYRAALLKELAAHSKGVKRLVDSPKSCCSGCCMARQVTPVNGGEL